MRRLSAAAGTLTIALVATGTSTAGMPGEGLALTGAATWHVEHDRGSDAAVAKGPNGIELRFALAGGRPTSQFAAAVAPLRDGAAAYQRLVVRAHADRPMRIAIQLRQRDNLGASRWRRTMYVDAEPRTMTFELRDFTPVEPERAPVPRLETIAALMLGVDTINTRPGTRASVAFAVVRLER